MIKFAVLTFFIQTLGDLAFWQFLQEYAPMIGAVLLVIVQSQYTVPFIDFLKSRFPFITGRVTQHVSGGLALVWGIVDVVVSGNFENNTLSWALVFGIGAYLFTQAEARHKLLEESTA